MDRLHVLSMHADSVFHVIYLRLAVLKRVDREFDVGLEVSAEVKPWVVLTFGTELLCVWLQLLQVKLDY